MINLRKPLLGLLASSCLSTAVSFGAVLAYEGFASDATGSGQNYTLGILLEGENHTRTGFQAAWYNGGNQTSSRNAESGSGSLIYPGYLTTDSGLGIVFNDSSVKSSASLDRDFNIADSAVNGGYYLAMLLDYSGSEGGFTLTGESDENTFIRNGNQITWDPAGGSATGGFTDTLANLGVSDSDPNLIVLQYTADQAGVPNNYYSQWNLWINPDLSEGTLGAPDFTGIGIGLFDGIGTARAPAAVGLSNARINSGSSINIDEIYLTDSPSDFMAFGAGSTFYVDPVAGSMSGDGSASNPWSTLEDVIADGLIETQKPKSWPYDGTGALVAYNSGAPVQPGDTIVLKSGDHGTAFLQAYYNQETITIKAADGATPVLEQIHLQGGKNWAFQGLTVTPPMPTNVTLIDLESHGFRGPVSDILVEDCEVYTIDDSSSWVVSDWINLAAHGIDVDASDCVIRNNSLRNVRRGIIARKANNLFEYNTIINFSGDGINIDDADYTTVAYNFIMNSYKVDDNHDDGIQGWSRGPTGQTAEGTVYGCVIKGNVIIETDDLSRPLIGSLQGIGFFSGFYEDFVVENNVVFVNQPHGIVMFGGINSKIVNNTAIDIDPSSGHIPKIRFNPHNTRGSGSRNVLRNNIGFLVLNTINSAGNGGAVLSNNHQIQSSAYSTYFVDASNFDVRLNTGSPAIDVGTSVDAPSEDLLGVSRPQGSAHDLGAYEGEF